MTTTVDLQQIANEIDNHIRSEGSGYLAWYCGIASNSQKRLFNGHNVDEKGGWWIYRDAGSETSARAIEDYFIKKGCKGASGGGDSATRYVYAYKVTVSTRE